MNTSKIINQVSKTQKKQIYKHLLESYRSG